MRGMVRRWIGGFLGLVLACGAVTAAEREPWSRFRGPNGTGVSEATGLPVSFGPEKNVRWKTPLPPGHSSSVLSGSRRRLWNLRTRQSARLARMSWSRSEASCLTWRICARFAGRWTPSVAC